MAWLLRLSWNCCNRPLVAVVFLLLLRQNASAEESGRLYVYAQRETPARGLMPVFCDGGVAAEIRRGTFLAINVSPGRHTLLTADGVPLTVEVSAQHDVFIRLDWHHQVGRPPIPAFSRVGGEKAASEMRFLSYVDKKRIRSDSVSRTDPRPPIQPRLRTRGVPQQNR